MSLDGGLAEALPASTGPTPDRTPAARRGDRGILVVTADAVRLAWRGDPAAAPERFELRPNQSYGVASGAVVEGPVRSRRTGQADRGPRP